MRYSKYRTCEYVKIGYNTGTSLGFTWNGALNNGNVKTTEGIDCWLYKKRKRHVDNDDTPSNFSLETDEARKLFEEFLLSEKSENYAIVKNGVFKDCIQLTMNLETQTTCGQFTETNLTFPVNNNILLDAVISGNVSEEGVLIGEYTFITHDSAVERARVDAAPHMAAIGEDVRRAQKKIDLTHFEFELGQVYETPGRKKAIFLGYVSSYSLRVKNLETEGSKALMPNLGQTNSVYGNSSWGSAENHSNYKIIPKKLEIGSIWVDIADFEANAPTYLERAYKNALGHASRVTFRERHQFNNMVEGSKVSNVDLDIVSSIKMNACHEVAKGRKKFSVRNTRLKRGYTASANRVEQKSREEENWHKYRKSYFGAYGIMKTYSRLASMTMYGMAPSIDECLTDEWGDKIELPEELKSK